MKKYFSITVKIVDDFGKVLFKLNGTPLEKGMKELNKFWYGKLK